MRFAETVQRVPFTGVTTDRVGGEKPRFGAPQAVQGAYAPGSGSTDGLAVEWDGELFVPFDQPATPHDRWVIRGEEYAVAGAPEQWRNPFTGRGHGIVIRVKRWEG